MEHALAVPVRRSPFAVVDALNREWAQVADADLATAAEAARCGDDVVLGRLVRAFLAEDRLAGLAVLQSQLGRLVRMAARDPRATVDDHVSAFWCVLAGYPLDRRPVRIAANLALDTLKAVHQERSWFGRSPASVWTAGDDLAALLDRRSEAEVGEPALCAIDVLGAGHQLRLIDEPTHRLLHAVYVEGLSGAEAAARLATTPGSLRVRCSRAVHRLADHASQLAEAA